MLHHCSNPPYGFSVFTKETVYLITWLMKNVHTKAESDEIAKKHKVQEVW